VYLSLVDGVGGWLQTGGKENSRKKLFVGGLPPSVDEQQLREGFSKYGKVSSVIVVVAFF